MPEPTDFLTGVKASAIIIQLVVSKVSIFVVIFDRFGYFNVEKWDDLSICLERGWSANAAYFIHSCQLVHSILTAQLKHLVHFQVFENKKIVFDVENWNSIYLWRRLTQRAHEKSNMCIYACFRTTIQGKRRKQDNEIRWRRLLYSPNCAKMGRYSLSMRIYKILLRTSYRTAQ